MPAGKASWTVTFYGADADPGTAPYDTIAAASVTAATGAVSATVYIVAPQATWEYQIDTLESVEGHRRARRERRRVFNVECLPFEYNDSASVQDLDDLDTLSSVMEKAHLWAVITGGTNVWPSTAGQVHPVTMEGWEQSVNKAAGWHNLTIALAHRDRT